MSKSTNIFFDTEFTGLHQKTTLISIGLISECGSTFYAEFTDYDKSQVNEWLEKNVISNLRLKIMDDRAVGSGKTWYPSNNNKTFNTECIGKSNFVKEDLIKWLSQFEKIDVWSDCLSYDWVLFCEFFGGALNIPKNIFYIPFDICTLFEAKYIDADINREEFSEINTTDSQKHNALWDAKVIKECYYKLMR